MGKMNDIALAIQKEMEEYKINNDDILELFTIGITGGDMTIGINLDLEGMVNKDTFMTNDEYDTIKEIVGHIIGRIGGLE